MKFLQRIHEVLGTLVNELHMVRDLRDLRFRNRHNLYNCYKKLHLNSMRRIFTLFEDFY